MICIVQNRELAFTKVGNEYVVIESPPETLVATARNIRKNTHWRRAQLLAPTRLNFIGWRAPLTFVKTRMLDDEFMRDNDCLTLRTKLGFSTAGDVDVIRINSLSPACRSPAAAG